jgi:type IV secretory pathway VirB6-like protein
MNENNYEVDAGLTDAAWAYNRWPTIGLAVGAGTGLVVGVVTYVGVLWTLVYIVALTVIGCAIGLIVARLMFGSSHRSSEVRLGLPDEPSDAESP